MDSIRIQADEAKRLKNDTAFQQFVQDVRDVQISIFANSAADFSSLSKMFAMCRSAYSQTALQTKWSSAKRRTQSCVH
jgi:hypothetical protein